MAEKQRETQRHSGHRVRKAELELGHDQQATLLPDEVKTELDVGGSTGKVNFEFVFTKGWGEARTPIDFTKWESTIETKDLKRSTESIDADAGIEDHTQLSAEATREGAFLNFESESYKSDLTLEKFFPEARTNSREVAFDRVNMKSTDSWSFLSLGGGQIKTSAGQDGEVIAKQPYARSAPKKRNRPLCAYEQGYLAQLTDGRTTKGNSRGTEITE